MEDRRSYNYRGWNVHFDPPPIPSRQFDWQATHPDYDGAEDAEDNRICVGGSRAEVQAEIDEWIADNETCPRNASARAGCCLAYIGVGVVILIIIAFAIAARAGLIPEGW